MFDDARLAHLLLRGVDEIERREILNGRATRVSRSVLWWLFPQTRRGSDKDTSEPRCFTVKHLS